MLRDVSLVGTACLIGFLGAAQNAVANDADVIRSFGMLGRLAIDCAAPMGESNPFLTYAIAANGSVTRTLQMKEGLDGTFPMRNLRLVGPDVLQYDETGRQSELTISVLRQPDGHFRSWRSVRTSGPETGEVLIENGKFKSGNETPVFTPCK